MKKQALVAMLLLTVFVSVQQALPQSSTPAAQHLYRASKIVGSGVRDGQDKRIGEVKDLILGSARGEIAYAVLSVGGALGIGGRYYAVPWQALQPSDDGTYYVLHADQDTLGKAPGFDRTKWPDLADRGWSTEVDRYWSRMVGHGMAGVNRLSSGVSGSNSTRNTSGGGTAGTGGAGSSGR